MGELAADVRRELTDSSEQRTGTRVGDEGGQRQ
jgi:hypothetical protein